MAIAYRKEIDGLRALAVIPVILFHAGFSWVRGGYVGVDVFFVISGYLITSIILADQKAGIFTIGQFYERRARRILPALFVVMLASLVPSWLWMSAEQLTEFARSLSAVSLFSSNVLFWRESGYFAPVVEQKPLLHTWSLAVEEQYYVIFPLLILFLWSLGRRRLMGVIAGGALLSLVLSEYIWRAHPAANFYLTPTRAWELLTGALIAFVCFDKPLSERVGPAVNQSLALLGLALVLLAVFAYDDTTPFPSLYALVPVLGTALIIAFAHQGTLVGGLLGRRALVGIGLISYSAYLWHQPLFAFARIRSLNEPPAYAYVALIAAAVVMAYFTWRYVEVPLRNRRNFSRRQIFSFGAGVSACLVAVGMIGALGAGFADRMPAAAKAWLAFKTPYLERRTGCYSDTELYIAPADYCVLGDKDRAPSLMLWGDSHAESLVTALGDTSERLGLSALQATYEACPPTLDVYRVDAGADHLCRQFNNDAFEFLKSSRDIRTVILLGRWTLYLEHALYDNGEGGVEKGEKLHLARVDGALDEPTRRRQLAEQIKSTVEQILALGKTVILVYPVPEVGWDVPTYAAKTALFGNGEAQPYLSTSYSQFKKRNASMYAALDAIAPHPNLVRVYPEKTLCGTVLADRCVANLNGAALYYDDDHLSNEGAALVISEMAGALRGGPPATVTAGPSRALAGWSPVE